MKGNPRWSGIKCNIAHASKLVFSRLVFYDAITLKLFIYSSRRVSSNQTRNNYRRCCLDG